MKRVIGSSQYLVTCECFRAGWYDGTSYIMQGWKYAVEIVLFFGTILKILQAENPY